jgi:hypothetical protein
MEGTVRVFISWSGARSQKLAEQFHGWLPRVIQQLDPYVSSRDIEKGARWASNLSAELARAQFGIVCLTATNLVEPWIQFEAGALSKSLEHGKVVPILFGVDELRLGANPLLQFQNTKFDQADMKKLIHSMNELLGPTALKEGILDDAFDKHWLDLKSTIGGILAQSELENRGLEADPNLAAMTELATLAREQLRRLGAVEDRLNSINSATLASSSHIEAIKLVDHMADLCDALREKISQLGSQNLASTDGSLTAWENDDVKYALGVLGGSSQALRNVSEKGGSVETVRKAILQLRQGVGGLRLY